MTITDEGKQIRAELAQMRPDQRRRYSPELRRRILDWIARCAVAGIPECDCSRMLGLKTYRFTLWRRYAAQAEKPLALVPIESPLLPSGALTLVTPSGYRVTGLALAELSTLLRELT